MNILNNKRTNDIIVNKWMKLINKLWIIRNNNWMTEWNSEWMKTWNRKVMHEIEAFYVSFVPYHKSGK